MFTCSLFSSSFSSVELVITLGFICYLSISVAYPCYDPWVCVLILRLCPVCVCASSTSTAAGGLIRVHQLQFVALPISGWCFCVCVVGSLMVSCQLSEFLLHVLLAQDSCFTFCLHKKVCA